MSLQSWMMSSVQKWEGEMTFEALLLGVGWLSAACYIFLGVSILCDDRLCPALEKMCEKFNIPTTMAAVTLLSFGSSAPELVIASFGAADNKTELSMPAVLMSALIAFAAIPPLVVWAAGPIELHLKPMFRDAGFYAVALLLFIFFNQSKEIDAMKAAALTLTYTIYLVVVYASEKSGAEDSDMQILHCESDQSFVTARDVEAADSPIKNGLVNAITHEPGSLEKPLLNTEQEEGNEKEEQDEDEEESGPIMTALQAPFTLIFKSVPSEMPAIAFAVSMFWLCLLSYWAMLCAEKVCACWNLSTATGGATLLAWGGQLPDTIAAIALAKAGHHNEAISQAVASQVINVTLGLGLPMLFYTGITGRPTVTANHEVVRMIACGVLVSIIAYFLAFLPTSLSARIADQTGKITTSRAAMLGLGFIGLYIGLLTVAEHQSP
jgi:Ca2+/Na+ antiporter